MFLYNAYGLQLHSHLALPELIPAATAEVSAVADISIQLTRHASPPDVAGGFEVSFSDPETIRIRSKLAGTFWMKRGREMLVEPTDDADDSLLRLFILGPALAMILYQRGLFILHASAARVGGEAVAFLGHSGWGKSTTAAALHARGHEVVADDMVAVQLGSGGLRPIVWPGFPQLKLWPEAADALGKDSENLPRLHRSSEKRGHRLTEGFSPSALPLKRIYVLAEGDRQQIEQLPPQESVIELVRHSFGTRLLSSQPGGAHFLRCANLARRMPLHRLSRPRALDELAALAQLIEQDSGSPAADPAPTAGSHAPVGYAP